MNNEPDAPKRGGMSGLMLAHVVCCGGVLLFVTGALTISAIGAWLSEGGLAWLAAGVAALAVGFWTRRRLASERGVNSDPRELHPGNHRSSTIARTSDGLG
jgi:hypothetical protein